MASPEVARNASVLARGNDKVTLRLIVGDRPDQVELMPMPAVYARGARPHTTLTLEDIR